MPTLIDLKTIDDITENIIENVAFNVKIFFNMTILLSLFILVTIKNSDQMFTELRLDLTIFHLTFFMQF